MPSSRVDDELLVRYYDLFICEQYFRGYFNMDARFTILLLFRTGSRGTLRLTVTFCYVFSYGMKVAYAILNDVWWMID